MSILVTGGLGFIGSHTVVELLNNNYNVVIVDNLINSSEKVVRHIGQISNKNFEIYVCDICDKKILSDIFISHDIQYVIHFAALKSVSESINDPIRYYENNVSGTINLLNVMKEHNVTNFIFSSSATVYGCGQAPFKETSNVGDGITNPYGMSKYIIECILKDLTNWSIYCLRYFNPIGAHRSGLLGDNPNGIPSNIMPYLIRVATGEYEYLNLYGDDYNTKDGSAERDYIHVVDLAKAHVYAIQHLKKGFHPINIGTGKSTSVIELIQTFEKINNVKINIKISPRRNGDVETSYCDNTLLANTFNWIPTMTIEDMCADSYNYALMTTR